MHISSEYIISRLSHYPTRQSCQNTCSRCASINDPLPIAAFHIIQQDTRQNCQNACMQSLGLRNAIFTCGYISCIWLAIYNVQHGRASVKDHLPITAIFQLLGIWSKLHYNNSAIRPLLIVKVFLVTSELTKACGRAVIIIHYSIILPQHIQYNYNLNISWTNQRQDVDIN